MNEELLTDRPITELHLGDLGVDEYHLDASALTLWKRVLGEVPPPGATASFSLTWLLQALRRTLGGIPSGGVLTRHQLAYGEEPSGRDAIRTEVTIVSLEHRTRYPRVQLRLVSAEAGRHLVTDYMDLIWPSGERVVRQKESSSEGRRPAPSPHLASTEYPPISRPQIELYAELSSDYNPMHLEPAAAQAAGFEAPLAHGPIPLAFAIGQIVPPDREWLTGLGVDARFVGPTYSDSPLKVVVTGDDSLEVRDSRRDRTLIACTYGVEAED